jgi:predicted esterase
MPRALPKRPALLPLLAILWPAASGAQGGAARAALGAAYLRMDAAYAAADQGGGIADSLRGVVNRQFDKATLLFFGGRFAQAIATIDTAYAALTGTAVAQVTPAALPVPPGGSDRRVRGEAPSAVRAALEARLGRLDSTGALAQAVASAKARAALLVDVPAPDRSAEFLSDPVLLAAEVTREVAALERGRNPYAGRRGDVWRVLRGEGGVLVPVRVVVPPSRRPLGVLVALHGAGGDENMFVDAYGAGVTPRMAAEANLVLVSPATTAFARSPATLDSLLAVLGREQRIDATRVYLLGHSMGAGAAAKLAGERPQLVRAAACLAGGAPVTVAGAPPVLFLGAALDPVIPASRVKAAATATPTGTYEERAQEGHTLMVGGGVRRAVPWLVSQPAR